MQEFVAFGLKGVVSPEVMRVIDKNADAYGVSAGNRMESAGTSLANAVRMENSDSVLILCGTGNNGGDGLVAARHLSKHLDVMVLLTGIPNSEESKAALKALKACPAEVKLITTESGAKECAGLFNTKLIVDALLGTGSYQPLREPYKTLVSLMNTSSAKVIACDLPTPGARCDRIIAFHLAKTENSEVYDIGIPLAAEVFCGEGDLLMIPKKSKNSHKGAGGSVLVVGGGPYQGAPFLSGVAALRSGADLVRVATPADGFMPDLIIEKLPGTHISGEHLETLLHYAENADSVICGPGLGTNPASLQVASMVVSASKKAVVDADLLRSPLPKAKDETIYTPHAGEFARVFGAPPTSVSERGIFVRSAAKKIGGTVILKGPTDIISDGTRIKFNQSGASPMTVGGTGDILSGCCGGLLARMDSFSAASSAIYAVGKCGEGESLKVGDGLMATDLLRSLASILYGSE